MKFFITYRFGWGEPIPGNFGIKPRKLDGNTVMSVRVKEITEKTIRRMEDALKIRIMEKYALDDDINVFITALFPLLDDPVKIKGEILWSTTGWAGTEK